jgi:polyphosphate kinase
VNQPASTSGALPTRIPGGSDPLEPASGHELIRRALKRATPSLTILPAASLLNMEMSHLAFQRRILELAADPSFPLLDRVRFLSIFGSNLDEFFRTRVAGFKHQLLLGSKKRTLDGISVRDQLRIIRQETSELLGLAYQEVLPSLFTRLAEHGIEISSAAGLEEEERTTIQWQYGHNLSPLLTPLRVDSTGRLPHVRNLRPTLAVQLLERNGSTSLGVLALPGDAPGLAPLPGGRRFVPLEEILKLELPRLFPAAEVTAAQLFRVTRSGNLHVEFESSQNLMEAVARGVALRPFEPVVRLEIGEEMPDELETRLLHAFAQEAEGRSRLDGEDVYRVAGLLDLNRLESIANLPVPELRYAKARRASPARRTSSLFDQLRTAPLLIRFPEHSFSGTVERFVLEASRAPDVEEIAVTLYRTNRSSRLVGLLREALQNGKRVVVFVEVKASFEERRNLEWARSMEAAGIQVLYGTAALKVHAKVALVRRNEQGHSATYSFVGSGNLNAATAATYTDLGILTADPAIGGELLELFDILADRPARGEFRELIVAPFNMRQRVLDLIGREAEHARAGRGGRITVKLNGVADKEIIAALYTASAAGVQIELIVRGICSLRPGVDGLSENIRVITHAGRHLEHSRIFRFENSGDPEHFIGSADWRGRNLSRRVEVMVPIRHPAHRTVLDRILIEKLEDPNAWELEPTGEYRRRS